MGESVYPPLTMFFVAPKLLEVWRLWLSQLGFLKNRLGAELHPLCSFCTCANDLSQNTEALQNFFLTFKNTFLVSQ